MKQVLSITFLLRP